MSPFLVFGVLGKHFPFILPCYTLMAGCYVFTSAVRVCLSFYLSIVCMSVRTSFPCNNLSIYYLALLVRNSTSLSDFKKNLREQERKPPIYFILGAEQPKYTTRDYDLSVALLILIYLKKNLLIALDVLVGKSRQLNIIYSVV